MRVAILIVTILIVTILIVAILIVAILIMIKWIELDTLLQRLAGGRRSALSTRICIIHVVTVACAEKENINTEAVDPVQSGEERGRRMRKNGARRRVFVAKR